MSQEIFISRARLIEMLADETKRQHVIGRALVVVFKNGSSNERSVNRTQGNDGKGFTQADARSGNITAKYYLKFGSLEQWQVDKWMKLDSKGYPRITRYWTQINAAAIELRDSRKAAGYKNGGVEGEILQPETLGEKIQRLMDANDIQGLNELMSRRI